MDTNTWPSHLSKIHEKTGTKNTLRTAAGTIDFETPTDLNDVTSARSDPEQENRQDASNFLGELEVGVKSEPKKKS